MTTYIKHYSFGEDIAEGKTKRVIAVKGKMGIGVILSKDDTTAGNGARHDNIPGKGILSNQSNEQDRMNSEGLTSPPSFYIGCIDNVFTLYILTI
jgi:hypothetical protein